MHAIAARVLGLVQGLIRGFDEFFVASHFVLVLGDADADGRVNSGCFIGDVRFLNNTAPIAFRIYLGAYQLGFRQQ